MRNIFLLFLIVLSLKCVSQPSIIPYTYSKQFSDEFNTSMMNSNLWLDLWVNYQEGTFFDNINNIRFGESSSIEPGTFVCNIISNYVDSPRYGTAWDGKKYAANYVCGQLNSVPTYKYGYFEARMKEPTSNVDICSAFWLWGGGYDKGGEIDIQENSSNTYLSVDKPASLLEVPYKSLMRNAVLYDGNTSDNTGGCWLVYNEHPIYRNGYLLDLSEAFHTYGLDWQPHYLDFYIDGVRKTHLTDADFYYPTPLSKASVSDLPPLILNLWTKRGGQTGNPPPQSDDCRLEIDYFRYYRNKPELVNTHIDFETKTADLYFSNGLPDSYTFGCESCRSANDTSGWVQLKLSNRVIKLEIQHSFVNPTAAMQLEPLRLQYIDSAACFGAFSTATDVLIAKKITARSIDNLSAPIYMKDRIVNYIAKDEITLDEGFEVQEGAIFSASIDGN